MKSKLSFKHHVIATSHTIDFDRTTVNIKPITSSISDAKGTLKPSKNQNTRTSSAIQVESSSK